MYDIRNYTNTKCELEMSKTRLSILMDRKEKLYCKYFPITSKIKELDVDGGEHNNDKMADYLHELHDIIDVGIGKSLADQIKEEQENVNKLQGYLDSMSESLSKMVGIEYQLFYEIAYKGINITKAVDNVAFANDIEPQTIWKNYYKKIKKYVNKLKVYGYNNQI
ncbi:MAG: hypothetical protein J6Y29_03875 [Clostridiales bacterium]|nr:hypothetical protein [Clostridiales bacterium]